MKRVYTQEQRSLGSEFSRQVVVQTAQQMLSRPSGLVSFSMDAIAREAGVARMTVFNLFGSRQGVLRAVCDAIAAEQGLDDATDILNTPDLHQALRRYVQAFVGFYAAHRLLLKHLRGYAAFDEELAQVLRERDDKRSAGLSYLVRRWHTLSPRASRSRRALALVHTLRAMLAFEVFELLSQSGQGEAAVAAQLEHALTAVLSAYAAQAPKAPMQ